MNMRKKCFTLAIVSFVLALAIYAFSYYLYHYFGTDGSFGTVFRSEPAKPLVTLYCGMWGVLHQFAAVISFLVGIIFFPKEPRG